MSGVITRIHSDPSERKYIFERVQDIEPILEHNKHLRSEQQRSDWGRHVAEIPNVIYEKLFNEYNAGRARPDLNMFGPEFSAYLARRLKDPDLAAFRVDAGANAFRIGYGQ